MFGPRSSSLEVTGAEVEALQAIMRAGTSEQRFVTRARIVILAAEGVANNRIAVQVGVSLPTVLFSSRLTRRLPLPHRGDRRIHQ